MVNSYLIRLWLISLLVCYALVSCQDIEPNTLEPEDSESTTFATVSTTETTMIETSPGTTTGPSSTSESDENETAVRVTSTTTIDQTEMTSKGVEATTSANEESTTVTTPESTPREDTIPTTTKPPCPKPSCYYKLIQKRVAWFFSTVCCLKCCYLKDLPYQKCRTVHPRICGYPTGRSYYFYADAVDYSVSNYSYY